MKFHGQTALVTGASSGIGAVFAREFAARGADLVLVARTKAALQALAAELRAAHRVQVRVLPADLSVPGAAAGLATQVAEHGLSIDVLVNNAGFATYGALTDTDLERLLGQVQLNCATLLELTGRFLPAMVARGAGTVVNVASTAAFQPLPRMAVYGATKAFVLSFTEALWAENRATGVRVLALCPGATETPFFDAVGADEASVGPRQSPEQVVAAAFGALRRGRHTVVCGRRNALSTRLPGLLPRRTVVTMTERVLRPRSVPRVTTQAQ
ncbi:SDR family oxidoreductase [Kitasatospora sp. NPDC004669]|uniref:SDR family NAD(P)-dependent oxidoreductase n=1 Tax=Kitasatospora sp. NPDC004669 TaxID=3154555 RepID=UPI0033B8C759